MNASDVMVRDVVRVEPEEPVSKAVQLLVDHDISALPVVDSDRRVNSWPMPLTGNICPISKTPPDR